MKRSVPTLLAVGLTVLAFAGFVSATGACSKPAASAEAPPAEATAVPPSGSPDPAAAGCTKNDDCHTQSFYCDSCQCLALGVGQKEPKCNGKPVQCLVDPCMKQKAVCDHGKCAMATQT